jgi:hypothetical protein
MAVSYSDKFFLQSDTQFQNRVREALISASVSIANEAITAGFGGAFLHKMRADFAALVVLNPDQYKMMFAAAVATDANVIADATQAGTVVLTTGNVAAQAALVTDAHIDNAISGEYNAFLILP